MTQKTKSIIKTIIYSLILVLTTVFLTNLFLRQERLHNSVTQIKHLQDEIVRSQSELVTRQDLEDFLSKLDLENIQKDLDRLNAALEGTQVVVVQSQGQHGSNLPSTSTVPNPTPVDENHPYGYLNNTQLLTLNEPFPKSWVPFGEAKFSAWKENPWDLEIYPRKYSVITVIGKDTSGRQVTYNKFIVRVKDKDYEIPISDAKYQQVAVQDSPASFYFAPRLYISTDFGSHLNPKTQAEVAPSIGISWFNYGKFKGNPDWSFLNTGIGYNSQSHTAVLTLAPASYNIGRNLPLINNLHIGPSVSLDSLWSFSAGFGVRVGL